MTSTITDTATRIITDALSTTPRPPEATSFVDESGQGVDYLAARELEILAADLISRHPEHIGHLAAVEIAFLWRAEGGKTAGKLTLGKCTKSSGLVKHFTDTAFVIWLAADHVRALLLGDTQIDALLFHELLHAGYDAEADKPAVIPHDLEAFTAEVEAYGLWRSELREMDAAMKQLRLPGAA